MALFSQLANVIEWEEYRDDVIFWKWSNKEIKKSSRLIIRPGQDAIFLYNGRIEGIFKDEGNYEIESQIIPFLSSLKGFRFGFNSGLRAEVLFVNVKEFTVKWGTKNAINIPAPGLPGGMPIRAFGTFQMKVQDYVALIDKVAGVKTTFSVSDVRERVLGLLDQLLMRWIVREGKDMFNLQVNAPEIAEGIRQDLDMELCGIGLAVTGFAIGSVSYPEEVQAKINRTASYSMVGDVGNYQRVAAADALGKGDGGTMGAAVGMAAGMHMAREMFDAQSAPVAQSAPTSPAASATSDADTKFCSECGKKIARSSKFCPECGGKVG